MVALITCKFIKKISRSLNYCNLGVKKALTKLSGLIIKKFTRT